MRAAAFALLITVLSVSACGQKGPLYLPQDEAPRSDSANTNRDDGSREQRPDVQ